MSEAKRNAPQRYNFGMGKRADSEGLLQNYFDDGKRPEGLQSPAYFDETNPIEFGIIKRPG